jgi:hypothetical protein
LARKDLHAVIGILAGAGTVLALVAYRNRSAGNRIVSERHAKGESDHGVSDAGAERTAQQISTELDVVNGVTFICRILLTGTLLSGIIIWARLLNRGGAVPVADGSVNVPANYAWILFVVLTLGHRIYARHLVKSILAFWESAAGGPSGAQRVLEQIRSTPNMFVFGMVPRVRRKPGTNIYIMERSDPSTVFSYFALICFVVAMLPWYVTSSGSLQWATGWALWLPTAAALILSYLNWRYGGYWFIALSQLSLKKDEAELLSTLKRLKETEQQRKNPRFARPSSNLEDKSVSSISRRDPSCM